MPTQRTAYSVAVNACFEGRSPQRRQVTYAVLLLLTSSGCGDYPLCDPELKANRAYVATISEVYNQQSSALYDSRYDMVLPEPWPSCAGWDGLGPGATISIDTSQRVAVGACDALWGNLTSLPGGASWHEDPNANIQGGFRQYGAFTAEGVLVSGPCRGYYKVAMERPDSQTSVFLPTSPGSLPSMVLGRTYAPEENDAGPSCPPCADSFVAQLAVAK
jgi:hypothetical protein